MKGWAVEGGDGCYVDLDDTEMAHSIITWSCRLAE